MKSGLILVDKPSGLTSARVVSILKKRLGLKKVGHAGTLDPMATGLLVILVNGATRLASYAEHGAKVYSGKFLFGTRTSTDDIEGDILETGLSVPSFELISEGSTSFLGEIEQVPPQVSAVRIDGQRSYKRVRRGEEVIIPARKVRITRLDLNPAADENEVEFLVECSRGTYIRAIARDLGDKLACGGCLSALRREASEPFSVEGAKALDDITESDIVGWDLLFPNAQRIELEASLASRLHAGDERVLKELPRCEAPYAIFSNLETSQALGLLREESKAWTFGVNIQ